MDMLLAQVTTPSDTGVSEVLANLSVGWVVGVAVILTVLRLLLMRPAGGAATGQPVEAPAMARGIAEILESLIIALVLVFLIIRPFFVQAFFIPSESMEPTLLGHDAGRSPSGSDHDDSVHDHIFVNKLVYRYSEPQRSDIIVFRAPAIADAESKFNGKPQVENVLIKRLIGVPGDTIEVKPDFVYENGRKTDTMSDFVFRNGKRLEEPDLKTEKDSHRHIEALYHINEPMNVNQPEQAIYGVTKPITLGPNQLFVMGDNRNDSNDSRYWGTLDRDRVIGKAELIFWPLNRLRLLR